MSTVREMLSIYIVVIMLAIGLYMFFVQANNLRDIDHMPKESQFVKNMGLVYIVLSIVGGIWLLF